VEAAALPEQVKTENAGGGVTTEVGRTARGRRIEGEEKEERGESQDPASGRP
jgi:hypothetical protein